MRFRPGFLRHTVRGALVILLAAAGYGVVDLHDPLVPGARTVPISFCLGVLTDPYLMAFVIVTAWLLRLLLSPFEPSASPWLLRHGSYRRALGAALREGTVVIGITTAMLAVGVAILVLTWPRVSTTGLAAGSAAARFARIGVGPGVGLILQLLVVSATLLVLQALFSSLRMLTGNRASEVCLALTVWLWMAAGTLGLVSPRTALDAGFFVNASLIPVSPTAFATAIGCLAGVGLTCVLAVSTADSRRNRRNRRSPRPRVPIFWLLCAVLVVGRFCILPAHDRSTFAGVVRSLVTTGGTFLGVLTLAILFLGYGADFLARSSYLTNGRLSQVLLRRGSWRALLTRMLSREMLRAALFTVGLLSWMALVFLAAGGRLPGQGWTSLMLSVVALSWLQIVVYVLVLILVRIRVPSPVTGLATLAALFAIAVLQEPPRPWVPVQLADVAVINNGETGPGAAVLIVGCGVLLGAISAAIHHSRRFA